MKRVSFVFVVLAALGGVTAVAFSACGGEDEEVTSKTAALHECPESDAAFKEQGWTVPDSYGGDCPSPEEIERLVDRQERLGSQFREPERMGERHRVRDLEDELDD
ncbi:MAG: hypothetical protein ACR2G3_12560 [Solirubrobacterales bacterium]